MDTGRRGATALLARRTQCGKVGKGGNLGEEDVLRLQVPVSVVHWAGNICMPMQVIKRASSVIEPEPEPAESH